MCVSDLEIPDQPSFYSCTGSLELQHNSLTGSIPTEIGYLSSNSFDMDIDVSYNALNGTIPTELASLFELDELWLVGNDFEGVLPANLCNDADNTRVYGNCGTLCGTCCTECF